ncbi:structural maintenance of chromosomes protein 4 [Halyomorpha halys]|uniref:structural maintenance of chromosomes protein 4 n=1 Tax=Halyomorpha halys TaxID=286706 RepID=UPI0006D4C96D|nr:structural maintenance of chromosomes protein 4 [Halyomorpha halys]
MVEKKKKRARKSNEKGKENDRPGENPVSDSEDSDVDDQEGGTRVAGIYFPPPPVQDVCVAEENSGPRLIITHIVNYNFKSYAGRQVLGPFHKSFTSIIGPNGSGKSNVIDSMLFVFGYRATKIRSKKISVLLHKSENHQNIRSATVEVHFVQVLDKGGEDYEILPHTEIYVSRTACHDNTSYYTINGKKVQFKEVAALLGKHGIDLKHNRFLILQGEVEQIAMMKPKGPNEHESGMLEYLEDIIGTSRLKKPLEKLDAKVLALCEERQEKLNRVKLAEKDKEAFRGPMESALEYLRQVNSRTKLHNKLFHCKKFQHQKELDKLKEDKESVSTEIAEKKASIKSTQQEIADSEKQMILKKKELDSLRSKKEKLKESFNKVEKRATQLKEEIAQKNRKRKKALENKKQEENKLAELEKLPEKNEKEIEELKVVEVKLRKERDVEEAEVQKILGSINEETKGLQETKNELSNTLIGLNKIKDEAKSKFEIAKTELELYLNNEKKEKEKLQKLKETLDGVVSKLESKNQDFERLQKSVPTLESNLKTKQKELQDIKVEESRLLKELHQQRATIEEKKHSLNMSQSRNKVLDFLMRQKEEGRLPGIFGRLGDLGGIDLKYDCAVSTAGGFLDHILVDTVATAKACVNALKSSGVGRGNFMALDQVGRTSYQEHVKTPENVPRLFDLIKVEDPRVKPAFYFCFRECLVANDLTQAKRVAYGAHRYRVVTLNGEIIEIAGTMSGGGRDKRTGRMGRSAVVVTDGTSPGTMGKLEERVRSLQQRAEMLHKQMNQLEEETGSISRELKVSKMDLASSSMEVKNLKQQEPSLRSQVQNQESVVASTVSDPEIVQKKNDDIVRLKKDFDEASANSEELEKKVAAVTSKINALTGGRIQTAQQKLDKVSKQLEKVTTEITKLTVAIKTAGRNSKKASERLQALINEINESEEAIRKAQEENQALDEEGVKLNEETKTVAETILEIEKMLMDAKEKLGQNSKGINSMKGSILELERKLEEVNKEIEIHKEKISSSDKKIAGLKLLEVPDEETDLELPKYTAEEALEFKKDNIGYLVTKHDEAISELNADLKVIDEYKEKDKILKERIAELEEITGIRNEARKGYDEFRKLRLNEFMAGFTIISAKLKEMYQMITLGGDAEFELIDSLDPFTEGIGFSVRPPKKSWKHISNLSGGEKTLSSLALVFALHYYKPSPLYVMDEIDAALDFKNVSIVGNYIKERTRNAQFIIISLRSNMFELADLLVGIYKTFNCTKSVTVTPEKYVCVYHGSGTVLVNTDYYRVCRPTTPVDDVDWSPPRKRVK